jgi:hypothetical protein
MENPIGKFKNNEKIKIENFFGKFIGKFSRFSTFYLVYFSSKNLVNFHENYLEFFLRFSLFLIPEN